MVDGPSLPPYARHILAVVVVVWVSLAGGSWLGRALIVSEVFGEKDQQVEFRSMPEPRARPWVKVDPEFEQEIENLRHAAGPSLGESSVGASRDALAPTASKNSSRTVEDKNAGSSKDPDVITATPVADEVVSPKGKFALQFASFVDPENAERLRDQLRSQRKDITIEKVDSKVGTLYRVKGPSFDSSEEAERAARELRLQSIQVIVVGD